MQLADYAAESAYVRIPSHIEEAHSPYTSAAVNE